MKQRFDHIVMKKFKEQSVTISKEGSRVTINCNNCDDAHFVFEWLIGLCENKETTEEYLLRYGVLDGMGNMDGFFIPLSIANLAITKALDNELEHKDHIAITRQKELEQLKRLKEKYEL